MKDNSLTLKELIKAKKRIDKYTQCNECKTNKRFIVLGYTGTYCKCEAERLSKTKISKQCQKEILKLSGFT